MGVSIPSTASEVAHEFVRLAARDKRPITQLELHKLVYAAHGWHLGICKEPLVLEEPQAWQFGPVYASLRSDLRAVGAQQITPQGWSMLGLPQSPVDEASKGIIAETWDAYRGLTPGELIDLTHMRGTPWHQVYDGTRHKPIPHDTIRDHFTRKLENQDAVRGL